MNKEEELLSKRIQELARLADVKYCPTYTDFLNLNEQNILQQTLPKLAYVQVACFGGYEGAERQIAAFVPDALSYRMEDVSSDSGFSPFSWPISCIRIEPLNLKFAEPLSHRDILGALMHLGIERSRMGDIAVCENQFYLFCHESMASLICSELTRIRHTSVRCITTDAADFVYTPKTKEMTGSVASIRLDALMAVAFQSSRSSLLSLISDGKVFVNGKLITTNAYAPKDGDLISARGEGKFRFVSSSGQTKKGRCLVKIEKYI